MTEFANTDAMQTREGEAFSHGVAVGTAFKDGLVRADGNWQRILDEGIAGLKRD